MVICTKQLPNIETIGKLKIASGVVWQERVLGSDDDIVNVAVHPDKKIVFAATNGKIFKHNATTGQWRHEGGAVSVGKAAEKKKGSTKPRRFRGWHVVAALFAGATLWYVRPYLNTYSEQDTCSFGSVTNEEYRVMLREARKDARIALRKMNNFATTYEPKSYDHETFKAYFRKNVQNSDDVEKMVAGMHARMRAIGAWHIESSYTYRKKPYAGRDFGAHFSYGILAQDVRQFRFIDAIFRYANVVYSIRRDAGTSLYYLSSPNAPAARFFSLKNFPSAGREYPKNPCPVVPQEKPAEAMGYLNFDLTTRENLSLA